MDIFNMLKLQNIICSVSVFFCIFMVNAKANSMDSRMKDLEFIHVDTRQEKDEIYFEYKVRNVSSKDLWLCVNNNRGESPGYETIYDSNNKKLELKVGNYQVPNDVLIEAPIYAEFIKLLPGKEKSFALKIKLPIRSFNPLDGWGQEYYELASLQEIIFSHDYYDLDLSNLTNECCEVQDQGTIFVNGFWAENQSEKMGYIKVYAQESE